MDKKCKIRWARAAAAEENIEDGDDDIDIGIDHKAEQNKKTQ